MHVITPGADERAARRNEIPKHFGIKNSTFVPRMPSIDVIVTQLRARLTRKSGREKKNFLGPPHWSSSSGETLLWAWKLENNTKVSFLLECFVVLLVSKWLDGILGLHSDSSWISSKLSARRSGRFWALSNCDKQSALEAFAESLMSVLTLDDSFSSQGGSSEDKWSQKL